MLTDEAEARFFEPPPLVVVPDQGVFDGVLTIAGVNVDWAVFIRGATHNLADTCVWDGDFEEAQQEYEKFWFWLTYVPEDEEMPVGALIAFAGSTAPSGWLPCDGRAVSRSQYSELFAAVGEIWGSGDGETTFNLPDLRGRVVGCVDTIEGNAANVTTDGNADNPGGTTGAEVHFLTRSETPTSTHHTDTQYFTMSAQYVHARWHVGGGQSHPNLQPTAFSIWIIKVE